VQEVKVFLLAFISMPEVFCCRLKQCLGLYKCLGNKRAAAFVIPFVFLGKSYIVPESSVLCSDVPWCCKGADYSCSIFTSILVALFGGERIVVMVCALRIRPGVMVSVLITVLMLRSWVSFPTALCRSFPSHKMEIIMFNLPHRAVVRTDIWKALSTNFYY